MLNQGTNRQKGCNLLSGSFFVSFLDKQKRKERFLKPTQIESTFNFFFVLFLDEKNQKSRATEKKAKNYSSGVK